MRIIVAFTLTLMASNAFAASDPTPVTTDELKTFCASAQYNRAPMPQTPEDVIILKSDTTCTTYVAALSDLIGLPTVAPLLRVCFPKGMTGTHLRGVIAHLIATAPKEMLEYGAPFTVVAGLRMNFPCAKPQGN